MAADLQEKLAIFGSRQPRRERGLGALCEASPKFAVFYRGVQGSARADRERFGVERAFTAVGKAEQQLTAVLAQPEHEVGYVLDPEIGPVVAVVQDESAVIRVHVDPRREGARHARMLDQRAVVTEATLGVEHDAALARAALGRRKAEELGMILGTHGSLRSLSIAHAPEISGLSPVGAPEISGAFHLIQDTRAREPGAARA